MKVIRNDTLPDRETCTGSLRHVLDALYVLNGKWKLALILCLMHSSKRFGEIQDEMKGISPKVLAKELKDLELNGFIERKVFPTSPVTIIYESNEYSQSLKNVLNELAVWGQQHREKVIQSMRKQS